MIKLSIAGIVTCILLSIRPGLAQDVGGPPGHDFNAIEINRYETLISAASNNGLLNDTDPGWRSNLVRLDGSFVGVKSEWERIDFGQVIARPGLLGISRSVWEGMPPWQRGLNLSTPQYALEGLNLATLEQFNIFRDGWDFMGVPGVLTPAAWPQPSIGLPSVLNGGGEGFIVGGSSYMYANVTVSEPERLVPFPETPGQSGYRFRVDGFSDVMSFYRPSVTDKATSAGCSAVLVSRRYALTSAHCIAKNAVDLASRVDIIEAIEGVPGWSKLTLKPDYAVRSYLNLGSAMGEIMDNQPNIIRTTRLPATIVYLPYSLAEMSDWNRLNALWAVLQSGKTERDIALIEFPNLIGKINQYLAFLPDDDQVGHHARITFAGYGVTEVASIDAGRAWARNLLVAGNWETRRTKDFLYWDSNGRGGGFPCSRDSGSGVFRGWRFGLPQDQRILLAIVATVSPAPVDGGPACVSQSGKAVLVQPFKAAICSIAPEVNGCG